jgi:hypothetical protein
MKKMEEEAKQELIEKAKDIIADIFDLSLDAEKDHFWSLNKATDAMYKFIDEIKNK